MTHAGFSVANGPPGGPRLPRSESDGMADHSRTATEPPRPPRELPKASSKGRPSTEPRTVATERAQYGHPTVPAFDLTERIPRPAAGRPARPRRTSPRRRCAVNSNPPHTRTRRHSTEQSPGPKEPGTDIPCQDRPEKVKGAIDSHRQRHRHEPGRCTTHRAIRETGPMRTKQELTDAIKRDRRAALVVNAHSRQGMRLYDTARTRLLAAGFTLLDTYPVDRPRELEATLAEAVGRGPDLLVAGGGDGTISTAARLLAHHDIALGLLPLGTTNNFARTVGIPLTLDGAVETLAEGKVIDVDLGLAGATAFTNHVGVGLS